MRDYGVVEALLALSLVSLPAPASALAGLNQCGPGLEPPPALRCRPDELLLGFRDPAGACVWACCPPNRDGTYDCSGEAFPSDFKMDLRRVSPRPWHGVFTPEPERIEPSE